MTRRQKWISAAMLAVVFLLSRIAGAELILLEPDDYAAFAGEGLTIGKGTQIYGTLGAGHDLMLKKGAMVTGDLYAAGSVKVKHGASVGGRVVAHGQAGPDTWDYILRDPPAFSHGSQNLDYGRNADVTLAAGTYRNLDVDRGATLHLSAGVYSFRNVDLGRDVRILADTELGDVILRVVRDMDSGPGNVFQRVGQGRLIIQTGGDLTLRQGSHVQAHLLSYADIDVKHETEVAGLIYAAKKAVVSNAVVVRPGSSDDDSLVVPEPSAAVLLVVGGACGMAVRRHRRIGTLR